MVGWFEAEPSATLDERGRNTPHPTGFHDSSGGVLVEESAFLVGCGGEPEEVPATPVVEDRLRVHLPAPCAEPAAEHDESAVTPSEDAHPTRDRGVPAAMNAARRAQRSAVLCASPRPPDAGTRIEEEPSRGRTMTMRTTTTAVVAVLATGAAAFWATGCGCDAGGGTGATSGTLAQGEARPHLIAVGHSLVFWSDDADGSVHAVPKAGGPATTLVSGGIGGLPSSLVADGDVVDWAAGDTILSASGPTSEPAVLFQQPGDVGALAVDATSLYWLEPGTGSVVAAPKAGGTPVVLAAGEALAGGIAVEQGVVYFTTGAAIRTVPAAGGPVTTLAPAAATGAIAVSGGQVAWIESGQWVYATRAAGTPLELGPTATTALAADAQEVFYFTPDGALVATAWDRSSTTTLSPGTGDVGQLGAGASTLYFTAPQAGEVLEVLEP